MRVLIVVYVKDVADIAYRCIDAIHNQTNQDFTFLIHEMRAAVLDEVPAKNKTKNVTRNRNHVRPLVLASGAEWILWVDGDVVLPLNAVSDFLKQADEHGYQLMGGWYQKINSPEWVAGCWSAPGVMRYFMAPMPGNIRADFIGIGCSMMHRSVLARLAFRSATDEHIRDENGGSHYVGNCLSFCEDAQKLGIAAHMIGSIICEHLPPVRPA